MTDAEHAVVLRRYMGGKRFTKAEAAAMERAIAVLEWVHENRAALADMGVPE